MADIKLRDIREWQAFCEQVQNSTGIAPNELPETKRLRIVRALKEYNYFVKTYFPLYADADCGYFHIEAANAIAKDPNILAVLEWPREHAKSVHANIIIPLWLIAKKEMTGMILMGKNGDDAKNLLADVQAQLQFNNLFGADFGDQYNSGSWVEGDFTTKSGIRFLGIGRDQSPRGARKNEKRPNYAVIDDIDDDIIVQNPRRVKEIIERIFGALYFALSIKGARMVVAGNRIHHNSVLANIVGDTKPTQPKRPGIYHSKVFATESRHGIKATIAEGGTPAWKERYTIGELERKIIKAGRIVSDREFYHNCTIEGSIFTDDLIRFKPRRKWHFYNVIIGYFDPSFENKVTSDFKAIRVWGLTGNERHCLGSFVRRTELTTCFHWMIQYEKSLPPGTGIIWYVEEQFFNRPIRDALEAVRSQTGHNLRVIVDKRDKENKYVRIVKMEPQYSLGNVFFDQELIHDPDMQAGNEQLKGIEPGYKSPDDAPDADEGAWHYLDMHMPSHQFKPLIGVKDHKSMY
jgi:hypothetical protein